MVAVVSGSGGGGGGGGSGLDCVLEVVWSIPWAQ